MQVIENRRNPKRGQALMLFVLAMIAVLGILALAVELGWSRYVGKQAQAAADAAALAAVEDALTQFYADGDYSNAGQVTEADCPATGNLQTGCLFAESNGFSTNGAGGTQSFKLTTGTDTPIPGLGVSADYWVRAEARQSLPQFFSGVISSTGVQPTASATAAIYEKPMTASMHLLNRAEDCFVSAAGLGLVCGEDFLAIGNNDITAPGGIYMSSSNGRGLGLPAISAGTALGWVDVESPFTYLMGDGAINPLLGLASIDWDSEPTNGFPDGDYFTDPMAGKPQPPAPTGLPDRPIVGGVIVGALFPWNAIDIPPGKYYAVLPDGTPTGTPITVTGHANFSDGAGTPCGGFCEYVFYGGLVTAALSNITVSPGRYVIAGAQPVAGAAGVGLTVGANARLRDLTPLVDGKIGPNSDAGEIFIFTNANYPGLQLPVDLAASGLSFPQVQAGAVVGLGGEITLHGLNKNHPALPAELRDYAPTLMWQDRANTTLAYDAKGFLDRTCGGICDNILSVPGSQEMIIQATQKNGRSGTNLYGIIYGPRGSWLTVLGVLPGDSIAGPLQIITGALQMTLNTDLELEQLPTPMTRKTIGLVQ